MRTLGMVMLSAVLGLATARGQAHKSVEPGQVTPADIEQMERDRQDAFVKGDADAIERATADTYVTVSAAGTVADKVRMMANIRSGRTKVLSVTLEDLSARAYGEVAVLTGIYRDTHVTNGEPGEAHSRFIRVFARGAEGWKAVAYQQTALPAR